MTTRNFKIAGLILGLSMLVPGCDSQNGPDSDPPSDNGESTGADDRQSKDDGSAGMDGKSTGSDSSDNDTGQTSGASGEVVDTTSAGDSGVGGESESGTGTGMDEAEESESGDQTESGKETETEGSEDSEETEGQLLNLGEACLLDEECDSKRCHVLFGAGVCSECNSDSQCRAEERGLNCAHDLEDAYSKCMDGEVSQECEGPLSCREGLHCGEVFLGYKVCGECGTDEHCEDEQRPHCTPVYDFLKQDELPRRGCVAAESLSSGTLCDLLGSGDAACVGECVSFVDVPLAVCGECDPEGEDCPEGMTCIPPQNGPMGPEGSSCEAANANASG